VRLEGLGQFLPCQLFIAAVTVVANTVIRMSEMAKLNEYRSLIWSYFRETNTSGMDGTDCQLPAFHTAGFLYLIHS
jgi:hypothetical protein